MTKISIVLKDLPKFSKRENRDYILKIESEKVTLRVVEFEFDYVVMRGMVVRGVRVPVRSVFEAIDAFNTSPMKAILEDGGYFWIMRSRCDADGNVSSLIAGNSSEFTVITRKTKFED